MSPEPKTVVQKVSFVVSLICTSAAFTLCVAAFILSFFKDYLSLGLFLSVIAFFIEIPALVASFFMGQRPRTFRVSYRVLCVFCVAAAFLLWFGLGSAVTYGWASLWG